MDDYPIKVGRALITLVDPHRGFEKAYNRWYERDHFYGGCMTGPDFFAGSRWVAPRALKDLRFPKDSAAVADPIDSGSYVAIYWRLLNEQDPAWATRQVGYLYANGRGFDERTHVHTKVYDFLGATYRDPDDGVPVELALDHGYGGIGLVFVDPVDGVSRDALADWLASTAAPVLFDNSAADLVANFFLPPPDPTVTPIVTQPGAKPAPGAPGGPTLGSDGGKPDHLAQVCFVEGDITASWDGFHAYAAAIDAGGKGRVTFAGPFHRTVVGTDTYSDQLW